jgi:peptide/nickel transport system substrate-binding protein
VSVAPSGSASANGPVPGSVLTASRFADWFNFCHPVEFQTGDQFQEWSLIFNTLVDVAADSQTLTPGLADTWESSPDATTYTFHLHPGVKWSDGTDFSSADVVYTVTWGGQNYDAYKGFLPEWNLVDGAEAALHTTNAISGVTAPDANTVVIKLAAPNADFLIALADMSNAILPQHALNGVTGANVEKSDFALCKAGAVVGTGPYVLQSYTPDQQGMFKANPNYFRGSPHIETIIYKLFSDASIGVAQLQSGDLNLGFRVPANEYDTLSQSSDLNVILAPNPGVISMAFLTQDPLVTDKRARQAFYYAINRKAMVDNYYHGRAKVLINPPGFKEYPDLNRYDYNPDMAKQLLAAANYDFSKPFRLLYNNTFPDVPQLAVLIQNDLKNVGVNVQLMGLDNAATNDLLLKQTGYDASIGVGGSEGLRPSVTNQYYVPADKGGAHVDYQYTNPEIFKLFAQGEATTDPAQRDAAYHQLALILNTDVPNMELLSPNLVDGASKKLGGGFQVHLNDRETMMNVETWTISQ